MAKIIQLRCSPTQGSINCRVSQQFDHRVFEKSRNVLDNFLFSIRLICYLYVFVRCVTKIGAVVQKKVLAELR